MATPLQTHAGVFFWGIGCRGCSYAVILNEVKNPKACKAVVGSANLEILRYAQDDIKKTSGEYQSTNPRNLILGVVPRVQHHHILVTAVVHLKA